MSNNNDALLSVCCLSYNHGNFIESCINSIWNNDYKNIEILALDDGSSDDSVEILNKLKIALSYDSDYARKYWACGS